LFAENTDVKSDKRAIGIERKHGGVADEERSYKGKIREQHQMKYSLETVVNYFAVLQLME